MASEVTLESLQPRILAAVRRRVAIGQVGSAFKPALDQVWSFLRSHRGLRGAGHNVFLYHHDSPEWMTIDFGVEVLRPFDRAGEVDCVTTPAGEAAVLVYRGGYDKIGEGHRALKQWCADNHRTIGAFSLEIYGDWSDDTQKLETTIQYLLR